MPALHFKEALSAWQPQRAANDNAPISADGFASLAARRAFIQREQGKPDPVLALPTLERLGRVAPDVVALWKFWRDLQASPASHIYNAPEIVHDFATTGSLRPERGLEDDPENANTGFSETELDIEIRPRVEELQRAWESATARRVYVTCTVRGGQRFDVQPVVDPVVTFKGGHAYIGPLAFRRGELIRFGRTARGVALKPIERLGEPKGSRKPKPQRDLRWLVRTDAPIARNAGFMAGDTHSTGRSGAPIECFAEAEQARKAEEQNLRAALGAHADILDLAITDATAREIGELRGYHGKTAERRGIFLINEAFAALRALVGEPQKLAA